MPKADDQTPDTRRRLLTAAQAEIADRGWAGIRTRGVADRAGVNSALVHYHFRSIDGLKRAALEWSLAEVGAEAFGDALSAPTLTEMIHSLGTRMAVVRTDAPAWRVLLEATVEAARDPALAGVIRGVGEGAVAVVGERLDTAVAAGELPAGTDIEGLARALLTLLDGVALYRFIVPDVDVTRMLDALGGLIDWRNR